MLKPSRNASMRLTQPNSQGCTTLASSPARKQKKGQYWAEAWLKKLTGGDVITARKMRCDDMEFTPKFKLTLVGNHKPKFRSVDEESADAFTLSPSITRFLRLTRM